MKNKQAVITYCFVGVLSVLIVWGLYDVYQRERHCREVEGQWEPGDEYCLEISDEQKKQTQSSGLYSRKN